MPLVRGLRGVANYEGLARCCKQLDPSPTSNFGAPPLVFACRPSRASPPSPSPQNPTPSSPATLDLLHLGQLPMSP